MKCALKSVCPKSLWSCPTLCNSMDCSPPCSSVHGILQAEILEGVAISFFNGSEDSHFENSLLFSLILLCYSCGCGTKGTPF